MKTVLLFCSLLSIVLQSAAQKKTEYYPNGAKKFEGDYFYAWKSADAGEMVWPLDTTELYGLGHIRLTEIDYYLNMFPSREYEGLCTFYFSNGSKAFQGNYSRGVKNGKFSYWWMDGTLVAEKNFVNGMADGKWLTYGLSKQAMITESYKAFGQAELDTLFRDAAESLIRDSKTEDKALDRHWKNMENRRKITYDYRDTELAGASRFTSQLDAFLKLLQQHSIWDGEFIYLDSETKKKVIEMYFDNNVPVGNWKVWDGKGKVEMEGSFKDGKLVKFKDHRPAPKLSEPTTTGPKQEALKQRKASKSKKEEAEGALKEPPPVIVEAPPPPQVFKYVEQMPEAPYDVNEYIRANLQMPTDTVAEGRINVNFVVQENGRITDVKTVGARRLPASYEQAALNVIKSMPPWRPGRQNGRTVKVYYTLPVGFRAK